MDKKYKLVIVESPSKSKTIAKYLGDGYKVTASRGHIMDLPKKGFGIDLETFKTEIVPIEGKEATIKEIIDLAKNASEIFLASDNDREGECIAFHLRDIIKRKDAKRVLINSITKNEVKKAIENPLELDEKKYEAQQTRRILDRIIGYKISPILQDKLQKGLSAGRVQSVTLKIIVKREEEILNFKPDFWFDLFADFEKDSIKFQAKYHGMSLEKAYKIRELSEATDIVNKIKDKNFKVVDMFSKEKIINPHPPYTTSKLQQEASTKLGFGAKDTMALAQKLYEGIEVAGYGRTGLITYMRTDSVRTEADALVNLRTYISTEIGDDYLAKEPIIHKQKKTDSKVQDAHEAIRPASLDFDPEKIKGSLSTDEYLLYKLIWNKFIASQMASAIEDVSTIILKVEDYFFKSVGAIERFDGYKKIFRDVKESKDEEESKTLPKLTIGSDLLPIKVPFFTKKSTTAPPRFSEASLVKELEENGIGRPSTFAAIIDNITKKEYVNLINKGTEKNPDKRFFPTEIGIKLSATLEQYFPKQMDIGFTSKTEESLDEIEEGTVKYKTLLKEFWLDLEKYIIIMKAEMPSIAREVREQNKTDIHCDKCETGYYVVKKAGNNEFLGCSNYPECKSTKNMEKDTKGNIVAVSGFKKNYTTEKCKTCGKRMVLIEPKGGNKFLSCEDYPTCKTTAPVPSKIICPKCKIGKLVERKSKTGKFFYGCNEYPKCDLTIWDEIIQKKCKHCSFGFLTKNERDNKKICYSCHKEN